MRHERVRDDQWQFEPLHLPFPSSRRPMRILGSIVRISALPVLDATKY
jgi:hypothetical protein